MSGVPPPTRERQRAQRRERRLARLKGSLPVALARRFIELDILTHAASLAFYALLSLAPLLVLLLWLTASLYGSAQEAIVDQVGELAGREAASVADTVIANADQRPGIGSIAGLWSTVLLFVGATAVFARLQDALNLIFRTDAARLPGLRAWIRKRVLSFGVVLALGFLLLVATAVSTLLQLILAGMPSLLPVFGSLTSLALYALSFALLYHFLP
ncbi:MAG: YhjD/YihY/BrkB family envelope integrity protein, partial [Rhizobacter sp.]